MARPTVTLKQGTFLGTELLRSGLPKVIEQFLDAELLRGGLPKVIEQFLGIPYGLSTGGERRFRPPLKVSPSTETFDASKYGQRCPSDTLDAVPMGEDCLNANVFRPKERDTTRKLPVVVHFHGGSFNFGSAQTRNIESLVAWSSEPMLGITFNYRLGAFGFLPIEGALNLGLQDQVLLLQWVQDNITEFGGDPNNVTIMGVSAGAHSIGHHLMNPTQPCLFHKAILESGAPTARLTYPYNHPLHQRQLQTFLEHAGCASVSSSQLLTTLRSLSVATIESASVLTFMDYNESVLWPFQPVIDTSPGSLIPISPIKRWLQGNYQKVPILTGFNTNEGAVFVPQRASSSSDFTNFFHTLLPDLSPFDLLSLNKIYPDPITVPTSPFKETRPRLGAQFKRLEQAYGHFAYVAPVRQTANFLSEDNTNSAPVYLYHFAVSAGPNGDCNHGDHCDFATHSFNHTPTLSLLSETMHAYWTSFICTGNPNLVPSSSSASAQKGRRLEGRIEWPVYNGNDGKKILLFGDGNNELAGGGNLGTVAKVVDDEWMVRECGFWWDRTLRLE